MGLSWIAKRNPALWLALAGIAGVVVDISSYYINDPDNPTAASWVALGIEVLLKIACIVLLLMTLIHLLSVFSKARRLLVLGATWAIALVVLASVLAVCRQPLVLLNADNACTRYVPGNGYSPDVGLKYVTPPKGISGGAEQVSEGSGNVVAEWYRREWSSGRVYLREVVLAILMAFGWVGIGRLFRNKVSLFFAVGLFTVGLLIAAQVVNHYLIWDYDIFLLGIWSDSLLLDTISMIFPTGSSAVSFAFAGAIGLSSLFAMRGLAGQCSPATCPQYRLPRP